MTTFSDPPVRPASLDATCRFNAYAETIAHDWAPLEHYYRRGGLRLILRRCRACDAFTIQAHGGHRRVLEEWLDGTLPIPSWPAYRSSEQPSAARPA